MSRFAIGLDFGTSSARVLVVNLDTRETAESVFAYLHGVDGVIIDPSDPNLARQHPQDYLDALQELLKFAAGVTRGGEVVGIGVDTTGSTPMPLQADGSPLAFAPEFAEEMAALAYLWKDHTAHAESAEITSLARSMGLPYLAKCGGTYSSEWYWSKLLRCARTAPAVFDGAAAWAEIADWIPAVLTGTTAPNEMARSRCAAGHKAMVSDAWGGLPSAEFLARLSPRLAAVRARPYRTPQTSDQVAGRLTQAWSERTGMPTGVPVAVGAFDAHMGAVGAGARPGVLVKIMGTSTCDCMVHPLDEDLSEIPGMCGVVEGSVVPGMWGLEAGQSAVGDLFNWVAKATGMTHESLTHEASLSRPGESGLLMLDWNNGNRCILVDPLLGGLLVGQSLSTTTGHIYRAAIEATAFGARRIIDQMESGGVRVDTVVACGGIAEKSDLVMDIYANVLNRPISVAASHQTCALGAAIFGAVAGGAFASVMEAQDALVDTPSQIYSPNPSDAETYAELYGLYRQLHDAFGLPGQHDLSRIMKDLIRIRGAIRG